MEDNEPTRLRVEQPHIPPPEPAHWLPGPAWAWVGGAIIVFLVAIVLAFSANGGGDDDALAVSDGVPDEAVGDVASTVDPEEGVSAAEPVDNEEGQSTDDLDPQVGVPDREEPVADPDPAAGVIDPIVEPDLTGFIIPIDAACLSEFEGHQPSSPREYRNGIHEGLDFYSWASCRRIDRSTAALAAKAGTVIRIDHLYLEITAAQFEEATDPANSLAEESRQELYLNQLRGRQVWIDHGAGVVTRYAHLSAVAAGLDVGDVVRAGEVVAFIGESGQIEVITAPGTDLHLHFEIRVGDEFLGEGLAPQEARSLYLEAFGLSGG